MTVDQPTITVTFTVKRTYQAEIDPRHFPGLPKPGIPQSDDDVGEAVWNYLDGRWTDRSLLAEYYANDRNWDGDEAEVEIDDVTVLR